jgi:hypothetical protein
MAGKIRNTYGILFRKRHGKFPHGRQERKDRMDNLKLKLKRYIMKIRCIELTQNCVKSGFNSVELSTSNMRALVNLLLCFS